MRKENRLDKINAKMARGGKRKAKKRGKKKGLSFYLLIFLAVIGSLALLLFLLPKPVERKIIRPVPPPPAPAAKLPEESPPHRSPASP